MYSKLHLYTTGQFSQSSVGIFRRFIYVLRL